MQIDSAVVLAAGEGRRLRPLTRFRPKPMLPAGTRPILERVFDALIDAGVDDLHVVVGYRRDRVRNHFGPTYRDRTITYHTQKTQLGSGHALFQAADAVDDDFLVVNGDEVATTNAVERVIETHSRESVATLAVVEGEDSREYAGVELDGGRRVTTLDETPEPGAYGLFNAGVYAFGPSVFSEIEATPQTNGERALSDTLVRLVERTGSVCGVRVDSPRAKATYPWDLLELAAVSLEGPTTDETGAGRETAVADSASVHEDATLRPPVAVADDAVVEAGAVVGPDVALGANTTVTAGSTLVGCVIDQDTRVGENTTLLDTVTGTGVEIAAGVTVPGGPGDVRIDMTVYEDRPLGAVVADRATVGGGATLAPGVLVGPEATVSPAATVRTNLAASTEVRQ